MKKFILPTIVFLITFAVIFSFFSGLFPRLTQVIMPTPTETLSSEEEDFGVPQEWLDKYDVTLDSFIDAKSDIDNDELNLLQEYKYNTNPRDPDTDKDGYDDGREVRNGYSPSGEGLMDTNENNVPDKWEIENNGKLVNDEFDDEDKDGLGIYDEYIFGTSPRNADTDGDGYSDGKEVHNGYDPDAPGGARPSVIVEIDKIDVEVPVVLSQDATEEVLQKDLDNGVIHYPGMAMPGQRGNVYIAGHSSNFVWSKGAYNDVFRNLNNLENGDKIVIKSKQQNGKEMTYTYTVTQKEEVAADDSRIFADTQSQELTLTTCWPLGTSSKRLMIKAELDEGTMG
ncbi:MAG: sortase [Patescibacteria group bacterium]